MAQSNGSVWLGRMASTAAREPPVGLEGFQDPPVRAPSYPSVCRSGWPQRVRPGLTVPGEAVDVLILDDLILTGKIDLLHSEASVPD